MLRWDIFCKIVDNFGDIGVCWRLARQLHFEHGLEIKLWIDDLEAAQAIISSLNLLESCQVCDEISIFHWTENADFSHAAEVVIEAFACELPPAYLVAMAHQQSKWVNLEYLSAENWVADFHAKPSPQANGLTRYFYFPGFTLATGGLIREANIAAQLHHDINPRLRAGEGARQRGRGAVYVNLDVAPLSNLSPVHEREALVVDVLKISLFCYPNAPIRDLFTALQANNHAVSVYVPATSILSQIADFFGAENISAGDYFSRDNLQVHIVPFLSQTDYDQLLRDCDLNFVRGEDSWLRAIWAGKPFIWQPYLQTENTHITKLNAFLDLFYADFSEKDMLQKAHQCWAAGHMPNDVLSDYLNNLNALKSYTSQQSQQLAKQPDLATKLVIFCSNPVFTK